MQETIKVKKVFAVVVLLVFVSLLFPTRSFALEGFDWTLVINGIYGAYFTSFAVSPYDPNIIYAGLYSGELWKSSDGGATWSKVNSIKGSNKITAIAFDVKDPHTIYVAIYGLGVAKSSDDGKTFEIYNAGLGDCYIISFAQDKTNPNILYVGTEGYGVFKSSDGGKTWEQSNNGLTSVWVFASNRKPYYKISSLAVDNNGNVYAGVMGGGLFKSTDNGSRWTNFNQGVSDFSDAYFVINSINISSEGIIYLGTSKGLYIQNGSSFVKKGSFDYVSDVKINQNVLLVGDSQKIYKSTDNGSTWQNISNGIITDWLLNLYFGDNGLIIALFNHYIYKSTDGGANWKSIWAIPGTNGIYDIKANPSNDKEIFIATYSGVFVSEDKGLNWKFLDSLPYASTYSIDFDSKGNIYISTDFGLFKSSDFKNYTKILDKPVFGLFISEKDPTLMLGYNISDQREVYKTTDSGATWRKSNTGLPEYANIYFITEDYSTGTFYLGSNYGLYKSLNGGNSWQLVLTGLDNYYANSLLVKDNVLYLATSKGLLKSDDGGKTWSKILDKACLSLYSVPSGAIYIGTGSGKVLVLENNIFFNLGNALPSEIYSLYVGADFTVFAGTHSSGLFVYKDVTAPVISIPISEPITVNSNTYKLTGKVSDNVGVASLLIKSGNNEQAVLFAPDGTFEIVLNLEEGTNNFTIFASDAVGNATLLTITIIYNKPTYTISASAGLGGSISPSGSITVNYGESKTFTITPNSGYKISNVKVDGSSVGAVPTYTFYNITSNHTIEVEFEKEITEIIIILQIGNKNFTVNGVQNTLDSPPIIKNGRTLVPIRPIVEALGGNVEWENSTRTVIIRLGSNVIQLQIGNANAIVNGENKLIDPTNLKVVPEIINGRTMLPLRFVIENLGCDVKWDGETKTITITYGG